jgi:ATP-dependent Clp protease ATP-binding subunit ClpA
VSDWVDEATEEARLAGVKRATIFHLARALARRAPSLFDKRFGDGAASRLLDERARPLDRWHLPHVDSLVEDLAGRRSVSDAIAWLEEVVPWLKGYGSTSEREMTPQDVTYELRGAAADLAKVVQPDSRIVGREDIVEELLRLICRKTPVTPLILGKAGSGKTALLHALASRMKTTPSLAGVPLVRIGTEALLRQDPAEALDRVLDNLSHGEVVAVDDLDAALSLGTTTVATPMLLRLRGAVEDSATRLILVIDERYVDRLDAIDDELEHELTRIELDDLSAETLYAISDRAAAELGRHHGVVVPSRLARAAAAAPSPKDSRVQPGLMIDRLDAACATAALRGDQEVIDEDLAVGEPEVDSGSFKAAPLIAALERRVRGQTHAITRIAQRLAVTRARLDLRPERPDGVFFLVGPTGVGKTALARALAEELFGSEERLIRLDMSEYVEAWSLSRIIGPHPGYVGSTQPESWLTTRVMAEPESVLLLDEIEKGHPDVWAAFLQVFDAGRLTDSRGEVADFSRTVILMTSNLGSEAFRDKLPVGFTDAATNRNTPLQRQQQVERAVEQVLPPELFNRLDTILVFNQLPEEVLVEIARAELERTRLRLLERGYRVCFEPEVAQLVAKLGHDPRYGGRHLERNIERHLLEPLAQLDARDVVAEAADGTISWRVRS